MPSLSTSISKISPSPPGAGRALPSFGRECRDTLVLALPLISGQLSQMLMGVADTIMVGRLGVVPLGAATLANTVLMVPFVLGLGLLSSVSVRISQASGAGRPHDAREALRHATWLALGYGLLVVLAVALGLPLLSRLGQPHEVVARTPIFLMTCAVSLVPSLLSMTWKSHADALNHPWPPFWIMLSGVGLNVVLNWLLIWGHGGLPALGLEGAGLATLIARTLVAVVMFRWITRSERVRHWTPPEWFVRCRLGAFFHLLAIGFPASLQMLTEVCAFSAASLLIGTLGAVALAAHQVAITCAATTFMVPLGVALAITVRVGEIVGAGERLRLRRVLLGGWLFAASFMSVSMLIFLLFGREIGAMFVSDAGVIGIAAKLLIVAGIFQLFDGLQVVSSCALRGVNDVRAPAWIAFFAYWIVALPCGAALGLGAHQGALGVWIGLAMGLGVTAAALGFRAWRKLSPSDFST
jgi:multidrug resistance protein, MATE family